VRRSGIGVPAIGAFLALAPGIACAGRLTTLSSDFPPGSIVISQSARKLYLVLDRGRAIVYPVAVAKRGMEWSGPARVAAKFVEPAWSPPDSVKRDHPGLPDLIPGGSPMNPMGARAITLDRSEIAIHGTTRAMRASVGTAASYGCIRMLNEDVIDLYERVDVGAPVTMAP
jgi:lipoprotein-anchoring transpeptidase ErfK/SrfK